MKNCYCNVYPFPHRPYGGDCNCDYEKDGVSEYGIKRFGWDYWFDDPREEALTIQERNPDFRNW